MTANPVESTYFDTAFRTNWFVGSNLAPSAEYPRIAYASVPAIGRRVNRAFVPLNVHL